MMRTVMTIGAGALLVILAGAAPAGEESDRGGLKVGDGVGAFKVVKAGGIDDGVEVGKNLCYM